jgi:hypothetical protein
MMGIQPSEWNRLSWWECQALLWNWNDRHTPAGEVEAEAPDADYVAKRAMRIEDNGIARMLH